MARKISYCPISKDYYVLMKQMLKPREIERVLMAVCDDFFGMEEVSDLDTETEWTFYNRLFDWAEEKHTAWCNQHRNFQENNPKKKKRVDQDP